MNRSNRCDLDPTRLAVWWSTKYVRDRLFRSVALILPSKQCLKMSAYAAQVLVDAKLIDMKELDEHRTSTD